MGFAIVIRDITVQKMLRKRTGFCMRRKDIIISYELAVISIVVKPVNFNAFAKAVSELGLYRVLMSQPPMKF